ncbi:5457_t:CDS:2 [Gigaspora margarita]|uniref:5457_t:CDS:1 n=1 Tax=Gigaspora margarita TaxID=4874 RepID=A0ABN7W477_GIGMA|nr:5457_t:CDS:2 [Gigaspora margarita]
MKGDLNVSREEFLNQKVELKDEKLETFIQTLGINRGRITDLRNAYEQLIIARKDYNQENMNNAKGTISTIKGEFLGGGISVANTQKVCRKCEKLVKIELELKQVYQEQHEARQENYYEILGISSNATEKEIASAYRKLALKYHPDKNKSPDAVERFREIKEAADFLLKEKGKSINSNNISDILEEIERIRVQNQAEMIEVIEKAFILFGASPQDLDPNL